MSVDDLLLTETTYVAPVTITPDTAKALRTAGAKVDHWVTERDRLIRQAALEGGSLRAIGTLAGLSHTAVRFIVDGRPERA